MAGWQSGHVGAGLEVEGRAGEHGPSPYAERVLDLVECIPVGRVLTYGDIAEWLGAGGPRQVASVLSSYGGAAPWWRVLRADGTHAAVLRLRGMAALEAEGTPLTPDGTRVRMRLARWDPST